MGKQRVHFLLVVLLGITILVGNLPLTTPAEASTTTAATNGQQVKVVVKDNVPNWIVTLQYLSVMGGNQNGDFAKWTWGTRGPTNNYKTWITTTNWWWVGQVRLDYTLNVGYGRVRSGTCWGNIAKYGMGTQTVTLTYYTNGGVSCR